MNYVSYLDTETLSELGVTGEDLELGAGKSDWARGGKGKWQWGRHRIVRRRLSLAATR
jgi:hypothetical protein